MKYRSRNSSKNYSNKFVSQKWLSNKYVLYTTLGLSLIITYIATLGMKVKEGLENATPDTTDTTTSKDNKNDPTTTTTDSTGTTPTTNINDLLSQVTNTSSSLPTTVTPSTTTATASSGFKNNNKKKHQEGIDIMSNKKSNRIDYASTVEDAYDDLNSILGSDGVQRLTHDTHKLMEQQVKLADAMKNMAPLIESAKSLMSGFDFNSLNNFGGIAAKIMNPK